MTDRELLELAAEAAGLDAWWSEPFGFMLLRSDGNRKWSPLENDGDALRLAVKLRITVTIGADAVEAHVGAADGSLEVCRRDPYAATRRAITRAAAQIQLDKENQ